MPGNRPLRGSHPDISWTAIVALFLVLCPFCSTPNATTFAVIKMNDVIGVAADSRVTLIIDHSREVRGPDICKIQKCTSNIYVVGAGAMINTKTGINFGNLAMRACKRRGSVQNRANWFEAQAIRAGRQIRAEDRRSVTGFGLVFVGYDGKATFFAARGFYPTPTGIRAEKRVDCFEGCPGKDQISYLFGAFKQTMALMLNDASVFKDGPTKAVEKLVAAEIEADKTGEIGFPMSVLEIRPTGPHWIRAGVCRDPSDSQANY